MGRWSGHGTVSPAPRRGRVSRSGCLRSSTRAAGRRPTSSPCSWLCWINAPAAAARAGARRRCFTRVRSLSGWRQSTGRRLCRTGGGGTWRNCGRSRCHVPRSPGRFSVCSLRRLRRSGPAGPPVRLRPGAGEQLVRLAPLIRPRIELHWTAMVAAINDVATEERELHRHLFGRDRLTPPRALKLVELIPWCFHEYRQSLLRDRPAPIRQRYRGGSSPPCTEQVDGRAGS